MVYLYKWLPNSCRSGAGQGKFAGYANLSSFTFHLYSQLLQCSCWTRLRIHTVRLHATCCCMERRYWYDSRPNDLPVTVCTTRCNHCRCMLCYVMLWSESQFFTIFMHMSVSSELTNSQWVKWINKPVDGSHGSWVSRPTAYEYTPWVRKKRDTMKWKSLFAIQW